MNRVYNYSAGPSMLPVEVLEQAQKEMLCYGESGMSVMEMSHRSKDFEAIIKQAEQDLRDLMHIPDNYKVLFVQGGGSTQFAMVPLNLMNKNKKANYIQTGQWAPFNTFLFALCSFLFIFAIFVTKRPFGGLIR